MSPAYILLIFFSKYDKILESPDRIIIEGAYISEAALVLHSFLIFIAAAPLNGKMIPVIVSNIIRFSPSVN